jgi:transposase
VTKRSYTDEEKAEALRLYEEVGPGEASRRLHIPMQTIASWGRRSGLQTNAPANVKAAIEMAQLTREAKRAAALDLMHDKLLDVLQRLDAPHTEFKSTKSGIEKVTHRKPPASAVKAYIDSAHTLLADIRLELGEATSVTEVNVRDRAAELLNQAAERRGLRSVS